MHQKATRNIARPVPAIRICSTQAELLLREAAFSTSNSGRIYRSESLACEKRLPGFKTQLANSSTPPPTVRNSNCSPHHPRSVPTASPSPGPAS
ncbi:hypothetical protein K431DRAFT_91831 [Polychaeton citri CBS 116435]|uniref:Uncharacterized protein n=1 Tax=Polychaeton citri CBS 116435 TaxID=1314669 RepID=A0A9P4Q8U4_9PEZI|nr:hypothetical protein K431DRAFT_91831 [Polychaeton citri CBS 116435]